MTIEEFYRDNYRIVYGYLLSLSGNAAVAEELASETFLRALQKPPHDQGACKPSTWLCAIAKNLYFSELRRQNGASLSRTQRRRTPSHLRSGLWIVKRRVPCSVWQRNCASPTGRCFFCGFPAPLPRNRRCGGENGILGARHFFPAKAMILSELEEAP